MAAQGTPQLGDRTRLLSRDDVAEGTMAFHFEKPQRFEFRPGQSSDVTLLDPPETDSEGNTRTFSIASAPFEDDLMIATRMRNTAFKRSLKRVPLGTTLQIDSPTGSFTLHKDSLKPAVFLAGGIGITPMFSIAKQAAHDRLPHKLYLFYSNHRPEDAPFLEALKSLERSHANFRFVGTMTEMVQSNRKWDGETGFINKAMLSRYVSDLQQPIYYIAGPPAMVVGLRKVLLASGINQDHIRADEFAGY